MLEVEEWNYDANAINKKEMLFNLILSLLFRAPVCGNAHCALAPHWSKKLGKCDFVAYQVFSPSLSQTHNCNFVLVVINNNVYSIQASSRSGVAKHSSRRTQPESATARKSCHCHGRVSFSLDFFELKHYIAYVLQLK